MACSCFQVVAVDGQKPIDKNAPITKFATNEVVFRGKLVKVDYLDSDTTEKRHFRRFVATFEVSRVWSGAVGKKLLMHTREGGGGDCLGFSTQVGSEWVMFAQHVKAYDRFLPDGRGGQQLWSGWLDLLARDTEIIEPAGACSDTSPIDYAIKTKLLDRLGEGRPPQD